jgi:molybdate transport system ATP-binding protein
VSGGCVRELDADVEVDIGTLRLRARLTVAAGELVAVLGPNGSGKSTLLRCIAGLLPIDDGHVIVDGVALDQPGRATFVAAERRPIGMVFQDYLLFPNLSAVENVAFGLRAGGVPRRQARDAAISWLGRVGLGDRAELRPRQLSGGQAQRVALARALARHPRLLLLDEPLAALDVSVRGDVRRDLRRHLDSFDGMSVLVTHDPVDAYALADRVVILEQGVITQQGSLTDVTSHPRSPYVAELVGLNLIAGVLRDHTLTADTGGAVVTGTAIGDGPAFVAVRPQAVALHRHRPEGSARNVWPVVVGDVDVQHDRVRVRLDGDVPLVAEITPAALAELAVRPGEAIWASVKATEVATYGR